MSVAAYSLFWGWPFAAGFVVLLFVHEMGHVIQLRREGLKASAPMFIPFLGACDHRQVARRERARGGARRASPARSSARSARRCAWRSAEATNSDMLRALAYVGFFLNLFNLLPVVPLDGGRAMAAMAPWMWFLGLGALVALLFVFPNPILLIIMLLRRHGDLAALEAARARARSSRPPTTASLPATACSSAPSTSG